MLMLDERFDLPLYKTHPELDADAAK